jgi:hypothetical protein
MPIIISPVLPQQIATQTANYVMAMIMVSAQVSQWIASVYVIMALATKLVRTPKA